MGNQSENPSSKKTIFLGLFVFLFISVLIIASLYVSVVAIPFLVASLIPILGVAFAASWIIPLIAVLPLIASMVALLKWLEVHWQTVSFYQRFIKNEETKKHAVYFTPLILSCIALDFDPEKDFRVLYDTIWFHPTREEFLESSVMSSYHQEVSGLELKEGAFSDYQKWAFFASIGLGIFLASKIVPLLMAVMLSTLGIPAGLAFLCGMAVGIGLIIVTYELLCLPTTLRHLLYREPLYRKPESQNQSWVVVWLKRGAALIGLGLGVFAGVIFFPPLVAVLATVLVPSMAGFVGVAVCLAVALVLMRVSSRLMVELPAWVIAEVRNHFGSDDTTDDTSQADKGSDFDDDNNSIHSFFEEGNPSLAAEDHKGAVNQQEHSSQPTPVNGLDNNTAPDDPEADDLSPYTLVSSKKTS